MTHSAPTFLIQRDRPEQEELARLIRECSIIPGECKSYFRLESQRGIGTIRYSTLCNGYEVNFPENNYNRYILHYKKDVDKKVAEWVCNEWDNLCWNDFKYIAPKEYDGDDPQTLDELCVFNRNLRNRDKVSRTEMKRVAMRFLDLIFVEAKDFAEQLGMPFRQLHLLSSKKNYRAKTDCKGRITYNIFYLFEDADSIRQTLVHELSHSLCSGHGKDFCKVMEDAMLSLKLIPRPCAYSDKIDSWYFGIRFPTGCYCPGYEFRHLSIHDEYVRSREFMDRISLWKVE